MTNERLKEIGDAVKMYESFPNMGQNTAPVLLCDAYRYIEVLERLLHDLQQDKGGVVEAARLMGRDEMIKAIRGHVPDNDPLYLGLPTLSDVPSIMELREEVRRLKEGQATDGGRFRSFKTTVTPHETA